MMEEDGRPPAERRQWAEADFDLGLALRSAVDALGDAVALWDADDALIWCNRMYLERSGCPEVLVPGVRFETYLRHLAEHGLVALNGLSPDDWVQWRLRNHANPPNEFEVERGSLVLLIREQRLPDGGVIMFNVDITDLKRRERKAIAAELSGVAAEKRFRDFAELSADWFWESNDQRELIYVSRSAEDVLLLPVEDLIGTRWQETPGVQAKPEQVAEMTKLINARESYRDFEFDLVRRDGTTVSLSVSGRPAYSDDGTFLGYYGIGRDITLEQESKQQLEEARQEAIAASLAKSEFLASMSHELRTPLNAIIGFSDMMAAERLGPIGSDSYREYAESIRESGASLLALVDSILDLTRLEAGAEAVLLEELRPVELIRSALVLAVERAAAKHQSIAIDLDERLPVVFVDRRRKIQVLVSILHNAIKHSPEHACISVTARTTDAGRLQLLVSDSGHGMDQATADEALSDLSQVTGSLPEAQDATGLPLSLCRALLRAHGGDLEVETEKGSGTTVVITMPSRDCAEVEESSFPFDQRAADAGVN